MTKHINQGWFSLTKIFEYFPKPLPIAFQKQKFQWPHNSISLTTYGFTVRRLKILNSNNANKGQQSVESSLYGLANMLALIAAFLVCPQIFDLTADPVYAYLHRSYGDAFIAEIGVYVWTLLASAAVYFFSRAMIVLAVILICQRLLVYVL